jgi:hypothetical protein
LANLLEKIITIKAQATPNSVININPVITV